jgi:hypothetical protein
VFEHVRITALDLHHILDTRDLAEYSTLGHLHLLHEAVEVLKDWEWVAVPQPRRRTLRPEVTVARFSGRVTRAKAFARLREALYDPCADQLRVCAYLLVQDSPLWTTPQNMVFFCFLPALCISIPPLAARIAPTLPRTFFPRPVCGPRWRPAIVRGIESAARSPASLR